MQKIRLSDVADVLDVSHTSFRIAFNVLSPNIERHKQHSTTRGQKGYVYDFGDICALMRSIVPRWNAIHEEQLYHIAKDRENAR